MFNRIVSLTMLALLASAPASADRKHHKPCPDELNGVRGTVEITGSIADRLTARTVQGCGFEVVEINLCQADVTDFYGCPAFIQDDVTCPQLVLVTPTQCLPCFGQSKNGAIPSQTIALWENAQEYLIRTRVKFCKPFCPCQLPSIALRLQSRSSLAGIGDPCALDVQGLPQAPNIVYTKDTSLPAPFNVVGIALARFELHPVTIRAVSSEEFEASFILTIFAPVGVDPNFSSFADDIFDGIFDPTADVRLRQHLHFQAEKECAPCCATGSCL